MAANNQRSHGFSHAAIISTRENQPNDCRVDDNHIAFVTHEVVLFEADLDVGIGLSDEIGIFQVVTLDEFDSENAHGEVKVLLN
jgi:hypothetical protein